MFRYLEKHSWWSTLDEKQVATIDELVKLCKAGEVERVIIPMTYYGYGASLIDLSNNRSIQRHYAANRLKDVQYNLTMSSYQFLKHSDFRELVEELQERDIVFDSQDYSELETETKLESLVSDLFYELNNDDSQLDVDWSREVIEEILLAGDWQTNIEWWEYVEIDSDGLTPYSTKEQITELAEVLKAKRAAKK